MTLTPDQRRAKTKKERYGEDYFQKIGRAGGKKNPNKFDSSRGSAAVKKRWERHRAKQDNEKKGEK